MKRLASCGDCGASVILSSAAPVIRAGGVVLLCDDCRGRAGGGKQGAPVAAAGSDEDSSEYEAISVSVEEGGEPLVDVDGGRVIDSSLGNSASGSIDSGAAAPPEDRDEKHR